MNIKFFIIYKNILIALILITVKIVNSSEMSWEPSYSSSYSSSFSNQMFTLISSENEKFQIPLNIAMQSELIKAALGSDNTNELPIYIPSRILNILVQAMLLLNNNSNIQNKRELYEIVQNKLLNLFQGEDSHLNQFFSYFNATETFELLINAIKLNFKNLENIFIDQLAQRLLTDDKQLNTNNLDEIIKLFTDKVTFKGIWPIIEKFYYLRSLHKRPSVDNLLINYNELLKTTLGIDQNNLQITEEKLIISWKLSINDLVDYDKIAVNSDTTLNLNNFFLSKLDGFNRIPNILNTTVLFISNNQITTLANHLHILNQLSHLDVSHNKIISIESSFNELKQLSGLDLSHNQIINLGNNLNGLNNLSSLNISYNKIVNIGDSLKNLNIGSLDVSHNKIKTLADSLNDLNHLETLDISFNEITDIMPNENILRRISIIEADNNPLNNESRELIENINAEIEDDEENEDDEDDDEYENNENQEENPQAMEIE